ncbi:MAG: hypothetical protein KME64_27130 [Scytonematopsis contorta HA4267-MV1]|nr:hypothetical protein [Scytonematopsis contorta HA4267-MV1]
MGSGEWGMGNGEWKIQTLQNFLIYNPYYQLLPPHSLLPLRLITIRIFRL